MLNLHYDSVLADARGGPLFVILFEMFLLHMAKFPGYLPSCMCDNKEKKQVDFFKTWTHLNESDA